jgi:hypothetical protein
LIQCGGSGYGSYFSGRSGSVSYGTRVPG